MTTLTLTAGTTARCTLDSFNPEAHILAHPTKPDRFIAVLIDKWGDESAYPVSPSGYSYTHNRIIIDPIDAVRETWDVLHPRVREVLIYTRREKKITAISALMALTGLSVTDAKRAIETFDA